VPAQASVGFVAGFVSRVTRPITAAWRRGRDVEALEAEVARLQSENAQLRQRLAEMDRDLDHAVRLTRVLPASELTFIVAPVIGRDSCTWADHVTVARGWRSGVRRGQLVLQPTERLVMAGSGDGVDTGAAVLAGATVVGRVTAVGPVHCVVRLVSDPASVMRAQVVGVRDGKPARTAAGVLRGGTSDRARLRLEYVRRRDDVKPGDIVLTSGYGGVLPAPLVVGRVEAVEPSTMPLLSDVVVAPEADLGSLRRVIVVREHSRLGPSAGRAP